MDTLTITVFILTFLLAGLVQGLTGFGFAIVGMAILPLVMDFQLAFSLVAMSGVIIPFLSLAQNRQGASGGPHWPLTIACILGVGGGFWYMHNFWTGTIFLQVFGAVLILFAIIDTILGRLRESFRMPEWMSWPLGITGGFFGGAFNIPGPPLVAFAWSQKDWTPGRIIAVLQYTFIAAMGLRLILMGGGGYFSAEGLITMTLWSFIPIIAGGLLGGWLGPKIRRDHLKNAVFVGVAILGFYYLINPPQNGSEEIRGEPGLDQSEE